LTGQVLFEREEYQKGSVRQRNLKNVSSLELTSVFTTFTFADEKLIECAHRAVLPKGNKFI